MSVPTIREVMTDPALFGNQFGGESWAAWRALLAGFYGLPLSKEERAIFHAITGHGNTPRQTQRELWLAIGRRGGKSQIAALLAVYLACFHDYRDRLSPGEVATVMVIAADRKQARTIMRYVSGLIASNPMLQRMVDNEGREQIELSNRCVIEVGTASFRSVRGYTLAAVICDEIAYFRSDESANPDTEILNALRPALATLDGKLVALSSPYRRAGELWKTHQRCFGKAGPVLVAQAQSRMMNPTLPEHVVIEAMERDPAAARAEYLAEFRNDLEAFVSIEVIREAVRPSPLELPYNNEHRYQAFVDPAGGGADEFTLAIGHREENRAVVDVLRAMRGTPDSIVAEYAALLKSYRVARVTGDRYGGSWPADAFQKHGITYDTADKSKSDYYQDALAVFNSGRVELPPDDRLVNQLAGLERRTSRAGKDSIDHPPGGHDDRANVIAGVACLVLLKKAVPLFTNISMNGPSPRFLAQQAGSQGALALAGLQQRTNSYFKDAAAMSKRSNSKPSPGRLSGTSGPGFQVMLPPTRSKKK